jgi:hypothetical protein
MVLRGWRKLHNEKVCNLYFSPDIGIIKSRKTGLAGHVACVEEMRNAHKILTAKPAGKRPLGKLRHRRDDNITRLERCTFWSTLKFLRCSSHHIMGIDICRTIKGITTVVSKVSMLSKVIVEIMLFNSGQTIMACGFSLAHRCILQLSTTLSNINVASSINSTPLTKFSFLAGCLDESLKKICFLEWSLGFSSCMHCRW